MKYKKGPKKSFIQKRQKLLGGSREKAEIQREALKRGKNLAFSKETCLEKQRVQSKVTPRKVGVGLEWRRELSKRRLGWRLVWWESTEKKGASHFLGLRGRHHYLDSRSNRIKAPCVASTVVETDGRRTKWLDHQHTRAADGRRQRSREIINEKREEYRSRNGSLQNTSTDLKEATFVILVNHTSAPITKERLSPTSKARREASRNKFVEKGEVPDRVKNFRKVNSSEDRPRARPGFVKPIRNGLRKIKNLI